MRKITALLASSVLLVAACGGDDDSAGSVQNDAADELIQEANDSNLNPDESCIRDKASKLSDDDAQKIVDSGTSDTTDLSPEGMTVVGEAMSCVSGSALLDSIIEGLPEGVDGDCLAQASLFTALAELVSTYGEDAVAKFVEGLSARVRNGEFSLKLAKQ